MPEEISTKGLPHEKLKPLLEQMKKKVLEHDVVKEVFDKYDLDEEERYLVPMCFAQIPVSARTDHGVIYINIDLVDSLINDDDFGIEDIEHYIAHEITHYCQQTTGDGPTESADADSYLDSPIEQEGFRNQTEYISSTQGEEDAEEYIDEVLDHHSDTGTEKKQKDRKKKLLQLAWDVDPSILVNG